MISWSYSCHAAYVNTNVIEQQQLINAAATCTQASCVPCLCVVFLIFGPSAPPISSTHLLILLNYMMVITLW